MLSQDLPDVLLSVGVLKIPDDHFEFRLFRAAKPVQHEAEVADPAAKHIGRETERNQCLNPAGIG